MGLTQAAASPQKNELSYDPGLTQRYSGTLKRIIDENGRLNVRRAGRTWRDASPYLYLINVSWPVFAVLVAVTFVAVNLCFGALYFSIGIGQFKGAEASTAGLQFLNLFFFSTHTLTTVGYGNMYPVGALANTVASVEALLGLLAFAIATGLLFGRFSRPSARFGFSTHMAVAPYRGVTGLQFRVVNRRSNNNLIDVEARMMLMTVEVVNGTAERKFTLLSLERTQVLFLALTWTVVHPIDENSPLFGKTAEELEQMQAEVVVTMKGFDETFGNTVYARKSYRYDEMKWGVKFSSAFEVEADGDLLLWVDRVGLTEAAPLREAVR